MGKKVYAIKEGFNFQTNEKVENKIVNTWSECLKYVKGVKGAKYKSFEDINSANKYLSEGSKLLKKEDLNYPEDCLHIYVDGSYNSSTEMYSYGVVAVRNNIVEYIDSKASKDSSKRNIRQIAGELEGAIKGVEYALDKGDRKVVIFHDYEGICHHATGFWERREQSSAEYYEKMNKLMNKGIQVIFVKVDSHTGDFFNELVDEKCKEKLLIQSDKVVEKWLLANSLNVSSEEIKQEIMKLAPKGEKKINVINSSDKKNEIGETAFEDVIKRYNENPKEAENLIFNLSGEEKNNFIIYLLDKCVQ
ncbi:reverse transcriptase-like protein [Clostridium sp. P21]|uniref:Reverse transcriptase-like protein n=1 Tax=Clostridium muellerianum TaxID=2716538 RepID=A0A7Y0EKB5_9CLOT|nr:ribonuclease H family protein [Clostridium muellerianum]NMM65049.1 reverse transcriptase-like protein [Clostridium muellerianum]